MSDFTFESWATRNLVSKKWSWNGQILKHFLLRPEMLDSDPESAFCTFYDKVEAARDLAFLEIIVKPKPSGISHNVWLLIPCKSKSKLFAKKSKNPSSENCLEFELFNSIYIKVVRAAMKFYYCNSFTECKYDLRQTWTLQVIKKYRKIHFLTGFV